MAESGRLSGARRRVVLVAGAAAAAGAAAGCQVYGRADPPPPPPGGVDPSGGDPGGADPSGGDTGGGDAGGGTPVASTGDVAVGGGLVLPDQSLVITQPVAGEFRGFSAICTHQGCTVTEVSDGVIICRCHNSQFSIEDGSVVQAAQGLTPDQQDPLPPAGITVDGDTITIG